MNEKLLQYIWQYQLFNKASLVTTDDDPIKIFKPGVINHHQGPDFSNALIKIDQEIWAGNIEVHINSTDWKRHQHVLEDHYDTIILHVVWNHDQDLLLPFPTLELKTLVPKLLIEKYTLLQQNESFIPCEKQVHSISFIALEKFKESLIAERLQQKSNDVFKLLNHVNGDWEEVAWQVLCRNMGGKVNGEAFESIAKILSFKLLSKYRYQPIYIEALLLGMAGLSRPHAQNKRAATRPPFAFKEPAPQPPLGKRTTVPAPAGVSICGASLTGASPMVSAPFSESFMFPVPEASLPAVEICSERSAAGTIFCAKETR